jgi:protein tyrosine/serine phosphatase
VRRFRRRLCAFGIATALLSGGYLLLLYVTGNLHAVVPNECYRSAQLSTAQLDKCVATCGIKSIINLRGENPGAAWYDDEVAESKRLGITHLNFRMSARQELSPTEADQLIALMRQAPKPLLIHCKSGSDRSGLAAALYLAAISNAGEDAAERQLSIRFGHFSLPFIAEYAMDRTWELLEPALGFPDS